MLLTANDGGERKGQQKWKMGDSELIANWGTRDQTKEACLVVQPIQKYMQ